MRSCQVWLVSLLAGGAVTVAVLSGSPGAGANPAPNVTPRNPPAVPRIVKTDGTLNLAVVTRVPLWMPPGDRGANRFAPAASFAQTLTPTQIARLSLAQRRTAHVAIAP
jgi:hypothetical protein